MDAFVELIKTNPEVVTAAMAAVAVVISLISIILTVITLWFQRTHNYKSVTPIANFGTWDYESELAVEIENSGVGPLLLDRVSVTHGNEKGEKKNVIDWMPALHNYRWSTFKSKLEGVVVSPQKIITLVRLEGDIDDSHFCGTRGIVRHALSKLTIQIEYSDIYGRKMPVKSQSLEWFGRPK